MTVTAMPGIKNFKLNSFATIMPKNWPKDHVNPRRGHTDSTEG